MHPFQRPLLAAAILSLPLLVSAHDHDQGYDDSDRPITSKGLAPLVEKVKRATAHFKNISTAQNEGWVAATPCVSGPTAGAMGVHFVLPARVGDGQVDGD